MGSEEKSKSKYKEKYRSKYNEKYKAKYKRKYKEKYRVKYREKYKAKYEMLKKETDVRGNEEIQESETGIDYRGMRDHENQEGTITQS